MPSEYEWGYQTGDLVEVENPANDPGFINSWWPAKVIDVKGGSPPKEVRVEFQCLSLNKREKRAWVKKLHKIRPAMHVESTDDSAKPLNQRNPGDSVEMKREVADVWWHQGFVLTVWDDKVEVYFQALKEHYFIEQESTLVAENHPIVRTARVWHPTSGWTVTPPNLQLEGAKDRRVASRPQGAPPLGEEAFSKEAQHASAAQPSPAAAVVAPGGGGGSAAAAEGAPVAGLAARGGIEDEDGRSLQGVEHAISTSSGGSKLARKRYTDDDIKVFCSVLQEHGLDYAQLRKALPERTQHSLKNFWTKHKQSEYHLRQYLDTYERKKGDSAAAGVGGSGSKAPPSAPAAGKAQEEATADVPPPLRPGASTLAAAVLKEGVQQKRKHGGKAAAPSHKDEVGAPPAATRSPVASPDRGVGPAPAPTRGPDTGTRPPSAVAAPTPAAVRAPKASEKHKQQKQQLKAAAPSERQPNAAKPGGTAAAGATAHPKAKPAGLAPGAAAVGSGPGSSHPPNLARVTSATAAGPRAETDMFALKKPLYNRAMAKLTAPSPVAARPTSGGQASAKVRMSSQAAHAAAHQQQAEGEDRLPAREAEARKMSKQMAEWSDDDGDDDLPLARVLSKEERAAAAKTTAAAADPRAPKAVAPTGDGTGTSSAGAGPSARPAPPQQQQADRRPVPPVKGRTPKLAATPSTAEASTASKSKNMPPQLKPVRRGVSGTKPGSGPGAAAAAPAEATAAPAAARPSSAAAPSKQAGPAAGAAACAPMASRAGARKWRKADGSHLRAGAPSSAQAKAKAQLMPPPKARPLSAAKPADPLRVGGGAKNGVDVAPPPGTSASAAVASSSKRQASRAAGSDQHMPTAKRQRINAEEGHTRNRSHILCLDNLGGGISRAELERLLRPLLPPIRELTLFEVPLGPERSYRGGWGCVRFNTTDDAAEALARLRRIYLLTPASPLPRPIIAHYPRWGRYPWGDSNRIPGHIEIGADGYTREQQQNNHVGHFAQMNHLEYDCALQWRHLNTAIAKAKAKLRALQRDELRAVMQKYCKDVDRPVPGQNGRPPAFPPPPGQATEYLWLRGTSGGDEAFFQQFIDHPQVHDVINPVSGRPFGHELLRLSCPHHARLVAQNLTEMVLLHRGMPRMVEGSVATAGGPIGSQALYNDALLAVFGASDADADPDAGRGGGGGGGRWKAVSLDNKPSCPEEQAAYALRVLLTVQYEQATALNHASAAKRAALHHEHETLFRAEVQKLFTLHRLNQDRAVAELRIAHKTPYDTVNNGKTPWVAMGMKPAPLPLMPVPNGGARAAAATAGPGTASTPAAADTAAAAQAAAGAAAAASRGNQHRGQGSISDRRSQQRQQQQQQLGPKGKQRDHPSGGSKGRGNGGGNAAAHHRASGGSGAGRGGSGRGPGLAGAVPLHRVKTGRVGKPPHQDKHSAQGKPHHQQRQHAAGPGQARRGPQGAGAHVAGRGQSALAR